MPEFEDLIDDELEREQRGKQLFLMFLDRERQKKGHLMALNARMGLTRSYVTTASLGWVAQNVRFATELPLFKEFRDAKGNVIVTRDTAAKVQQRDLDWRRQYPMTLYLAKRKAHKFPALLLVVTQQWVDDPSSDEWGADKRAQKDSINIQSLDTSGTVLDLGIGEEDLLYAIDGQHRLMAIRGLSELLQGRLFVKNRESKPLKNSITPEDVVEESRGAMSLADLQGLMSERIGIEIIPAVLKGETREEALRRVRSIFVHVNRTAQPLSKGEIALLDEDDGFAVVARYVVVMHKLLSDDDRVHMTKGQLAASSKELTTLETVVAISTQFLKQHGQFHHWKPDSRSEMCMRPEEESLDEGYELLMSYFDALAQIHSYQRVLQGGEPKKFRETDHNMLFRPMAQMAMANALGGLVTSAEKPRTLQSLITVISAKDEEDVFNYTDPKNPWYGVIWDPAKKKMLRTAGAQLLCTNILTHLLGGGTGDDKEFDQLQEAFASARTIALDDEVFAVDLKGERVTPDKVLLPSPW